MKSLILSYNPGMFGEFIASKIVESNSEFISIKKTNTTRENRFLYPNYLFPIDLDCKNLPADSKWPISEKDISILNSHYNDKTICLPTHWYSKNIEDSNLPSLGLKLYSEDLTIVNLAYCMFWIKSHVFANQLMSVRQQEIVNLIESNHKYSDKLQKLLEPGNYQNWKFLALRSNCVVNNEPNLLLYFFTRYKSYIEWNKKSVNISNKWHYIDAGKIIYLDQTEITTLEQIIKGRLNQSDIKNYSIKNEELLTEKLNITLKDLAGDKWLKLLYDYVASCLQS
jgi:hypothetical protein